MRVVGLSTTLCALLLAQPAFAQEWTEYVNKTDLFSVPAPGQPTTTAITWDSEYGAKFPGNVYTWTEGADRYTVTVVNFSDAERIQSAAGRAQLGPVASAVHCPREGARDVPVGLGELVLPRPGMAARPQLPQDARRYRLGGSLADPVHHQHRLRAKAQIV